MHGTLHLQARMEGGPFSTAGTTSNPLLRDYRAYLPSRTRPNATYSFAYAARCCSSPSRTSYFMSPTMRWAWLVRPLRRDRRVGRSSSTDSFLFFDGHVVGCSRMVEFPCPLLVHIGGNKTHVSACLTM